MGLSSCAAHLDSLANRSVRGNAIHMEELESAEPENNSNRLRHALIRALQLLGG
jgi:hypothetical protein